MITVPDAPSPIQPATLASGPISIDAPIYSGKGASQLREFIFRLNEYLDVRGIKDPGLRLRFAICQLRGQALVYLQFLEAQGSRPSTLEELYALLKSRFGHEDMVVNIQRLQELRQTSSAEHYVSSFERVALEVGNMDPTMLTALFLTGLKEPLRAAVRNHNPTNLASAFQLALQWSQICGQQDSSYADRRHQRNNDRDRFRDHHDQHGRHDRSGQRSFDGQRDRAKPYDSQNRNRPYGPRNGGGQQDGQRRNDFDRQPHHSNNNGNNASSFAQHLNKHQQ